MKNMKKLFAILVATLMIVASMSALAADTYQIPSSSGAATAGDLGIDATIKITNLDDGDQVNLYRVLEWNEGNGGWKLADGFEDLDNSSSASYSPNIHKILTNDPNYTGELTKEDVEKITNLIKSKSIAYVDQKTTNGTEYTYTSGNKPGMYVALVKPVTPGTVYNPIVVSADFYNTNTTNEIDASTAKLGTTAIAKKEPDTVLKTEPKITNDIGDTYSFTVDTTIPAYADSFKNTYFVFNDVTSDLLDIDKTSVKIKGMTIDDFVKTIKADAVKGTDYDYTIEDNKITFRLEDSVIKAQSKATSITITYDAKLNVAADEVPKLTSVKEEYNKVTVEFPNNPNDDSDKTVIKDETREYTFSIDGTLFGNEDWQTGEVVKIGKDAQGNIIESYRELDNGTKHGALAGAKFGLYTAQDETKLYTNQQFDGYVTTDANGLMKIDGLDAGTYYLKEITAPAGYIKDQIWHEVVITPVIENEPVTEYYTIASNGTVTWSKTKSTGSTEYTYYVPILKSYTVTVDGKTSSYTMTLDGPSISTVTPAESTDEIENTKGVELPSTGGIGTTLFYIGGAVLVLGAVVVMITRRRVRG